MYKRVLIPLDGSKEAEGVFPRIKNEVALDGEVILLMIVSPGKTQTAGGGYVILGTQLEEDARMAALSYLKSVARDMKGNPGQWRCEVAVADSVSKGIMEFARRERVDYIAMYTHIRRGLGRIFKVSVVAEVQRSASAEVKVFIPLDLSLDVPAEALADTRVTNGSSPSSNSRVLK